MYHRRDLDQAERDAKEAALRAEIERLRNEELQLMLAKESGILTPQQKQQINDVRCRLYWIYRIPKGDLKQVKVFYTTRILHHIYACIFFGLIKILI